VPPRRTIPPQRRHRSVRAIIGSFGDQLPHVGVGQRFRISTGLPEVNKIQNSAKTTSRELRLDPAPGNTDDRKANSCTSPARLWLFSCLHAVTGDNFLYVLRRKAYPTHPLAGVRSAPCHGCRCGQRSAEAVGELLDDAI
jgi:hypothetical protein